MQIGEDSLYCPGLNLLWANRPGDGTPASSIHKIYAREVWRSRNMFGRAVLVSRYLTWPIIVSGAIGYFTVRNGVAIKRRMGKGVIRQICDQYVLAARHAILPPWYYMFDLYKENNFNRAGQYLHRFETKKGVYALLRNYVEHHVNEPLKDKALFATVSQENDLPIAPVVAVVESDGFHALGARQATSKPEDLLPDRDLFIKPLKGKGGRGTLSARFAGKATYKMNDGSVLSRAELVQHLMSLGRDEAQIVQHSLKNHEDIADLCANALSCVRIMTCLTKEGDYEVTNAVFRMAMNEDANVDGLHRGGLAAKVDIETGALGLATNLGLTPEVGWVEKNPHTGVQITGRIIPMWPEMRALAEEAHAAFPKKVMVGWDIAPTPDGPIIVEGNSSPCVDIIQRVDCEPLGAQRFGELLAYHVECAIQERDRLEDTRNAG